jgi:hypothetical protein
MLHGLNLSFKERAIARKATRLIDRLNGPLVALSAHYWNNETMSATDQKADLR